MSAYGEYETTLCDQKFLVGGLFDMGYTVEVYPDEGALLIAYHGDEGRWFESTRPDQIPQILTDTGFTPFRGDSQAIRPSRARPDPI